MYWCLNGANTWSLFIVGGFGCLSWIENGVVIVLLQSAKVWNWHTRCAVDHSGRRSMKNVANCDNFREMQIYLNGKVLNAHGSCEYHIRSYIRLRIVKKNVMSQLVCSLLWAIVDAAVTGCLASRRLRLLCHDGLFQTVVGEIEMAYCVCWSNLAHKCSE